MYSDNPHHPLKAYGIDCDDPTVNCGTAILLARSVPNGTRDNNVIENIQDLRLGLSGVLDMAGGLEWEANVQVVDNDIDNMIQWTLVNPPWEGYNRNIAEARIDGLELGYDFTGDHLDLHLGGSWKDPEDRTTGEQLLRRARYSLDARVGYDWNRWHFGASALHSGKRKDFGNTTLGSYTLVNLDASYRLTDEWQLFAKLENTFDEDYQLASGYNTAGRTGYLGIRYR